jgi:hypothetical protein
MSCFAQIERWPANRISPAQNQKSLAQGGTWPAQGEFCPRKSKNVRANRELPAQAGKLVAQGEFRPRKPGFGLHQPGGLRRRPDSGRAESDADIGSLSMFHFLNGIAGTIDGFAQGDVALVLSNVAPARAVGGHRTPRRFAFAGSPRNSRQRFGLCQPSGAFPSPANSPSLQTLNLELAAQIEF